MMGTWLIARRELTAYLRGALGPVVVATALLIDGILFYFLGLQEKRLSAEILGQFFYLTSGLVMLAMPLLTMRLVAEERQNGTFVLLETAPVTEAQVVLGKYLAALGVLLLFLALSSYLPLWILVRGKVSLGHLLTGYLGLALLGAAVAALGLFASALVSSQLLALAIDVALLVPLVLMWAIGRAVDAPYGTFFSNMALHNENFQPFILGVLEFGNVAYYLAVAAFFLVAATKTVEARRWQ